MFSNIGREINEKGRRINIKRNLVTISILVFTFFLNGCSGFSLHKPEVKLPTEICVKNKILSYYDDADDFEKCGFSVEEWLSKNSLESKHNEVIIDKEGKVRFIAIRDDSVSTYKNITIGTSKDEIENAFQYEKKEGDHYNVLFDGDVELNRKDEILMMESNFIYIYYYIENDVVSEIQIYDALFLHTGR